MLGSKSKIDGMVMVPLIIWSTHKVIALLNLVQFQIRLRVKHFCKVAWYAGFGRTMNFTRSDLISKEWILLLQKGENHGSYFI